MASCLDSKDINQINESEEEMETVKNKIRKLNLPSEIKKTILSMMAFKPDNRITSFALYTRKISDLLHKQNQIPLQLKGKDSFKFILKLDWIFIDFEDRKFKYKKIKA